MAVWQQNAYLGLCEKEHLKIESSIFNANDRTSLSVALSVGLSVTVIIRVHHHCSYATLLELGP